MYSDGIPSVPLPVPGASPPSIAQIVPFRFHLTYWLNLELTYGRKHVFSFLPLALFPPPQSIGP